MTPVVTSQRTPKRRAAQSSSGSHARGLPRHQRRGRRRGSTEGRSRHRPRSDPPPRDLAAHLVDRGIGGAGGGHRVGPDRSLLRAHSARPYRPARGSAGSAGLWPACATAPVQPDGKAAVDRFTATSFQNRRAAQPLMPPPQSCRARPPARRSPSITRSARRASAGARVIAPAHADRAHAGGAAHLDVKVVSPIITAWRFRAGLGQAARSIAGMRLGRVVVGHLRVSRKKPPARAPSSTWSSPRRDLPVATPRTSRRARPAASKHRPRAGIERRVGFALARPGAKLRL
jgi:hypothetical protein